MIKKLELSGSQHQAWDKYADERVITEARLAASEKRFLMDCLQELGGKLNEPWQFDAASRTFWMEAKEEPLRNGDIVYTDFNDQRRVAENLPTETRGQGTR